MLHVTVPRNGLKRHWHADDPQLVHPQVPHVDSVVIAVVRAAAGRGARRPINTATRPTVRNTTPTIQERLLPLRFMVILPSIRVRVLYR